MGGTKCVVRGCKSGTKKQKKIAHHRFPLQTNRCMEWLRMCGRQDLMNSTAESLHKTKRICSAHFDKQMYSNPEKTRLLPLAIPTIFEHCEQETNEDSSGIVQIDERFYDPIFTPLSMEELLKILDDNLSYNSSYMFTDI